MKPIIKETLQKKTGKDKLLYFLYAYKEFFIAGIIALVAVFFFYFSFTNKTESILNVQILTETNQDATLVGELENQYTAALKPVGKEEIQVSLSDFTDPGAQQVFASLIAAKEIDLIWMPENLESEFVKRYDPDDISKTDLQFEKDNVTYIARIIPKAPHKENLNAIKELYR